MKLIDNVETRITSIFDPLFKLCERMEDVDRMIALVRNDLDSVFFRRLDMTIQVQSMHSKGLSLQPHQLESALRTYLVNDRADLAIEAIAETITVCRRSPSMRCYAAVFQYLTDKDLPHHAVELLKLMSANGQSPDTTIFSILEKMRRYDIVLEGIES